MNKEHTARSLNIIQHELHELAKFWRRIVVAAQLIVLILGGLSVISGNSTVEITALLGLVTIISIAAQWRSDFLRSKAQSVLRKFELQDGLGWLVDDLDLRDMRIRLPKYIKNKIEVSMDQKETYFESAEQRSIKRSLENLTESVYWSKHIAERSALIFATISFFIFVLAIVLFCLSVQSGITQPVNSSIAKAAISMIVFGFSAGFLRFAYDYWMFSKSAAVIESAAWKILSEQDPEFVDGVKLIQEYQLARAGSPLLPSLLYKLMNDELNTEWKKFLSSRSSNPKIDH